jgi:hypothetical protein
MKIKEKKKVEKKDDWKSGGEWMVINKLKDEEDNEIFKKGLFVINIK